LKNPTSSNFFLINTDAGIPKSLFILSRYSFSSGRSNKFTFLDKISLH